MTDGIRPRMLDLFSGAGGAAVGYHRAGFDVTGVDIKPQPRYPFTFHQADALEFLTEHGHEFDAIHASPPCQAYSQSALAHRNQGKQYPDLVDQVRDALSEMGSPWVIENVPRSPVRPDFRLCGCHFGLDLRRERWFEVSWDALVLMPPHHHPYPVVSVVGHGTPTWVRERLGFNPTITHYREAMGIDWMNRGELSQAIPPAYTEFIGRQLLTHLTPTFPFSASFPILPTPAGMVPTHPGPTGGAFRPRDTERSLVEAARPGLHDWRCAT